MKPEELTGRAETHTVLIAQWNTRLHREVEKPILNMMQAASREGFELFPCSAFRSFDSQLKIWNAKATGERPVLDAKGKALDVSTMKPKEIVDAILRWSALPGASRHHWGTDCDVIDKAALTKDYKVQLVPEEFKKGGIFAGLHEWLDENLEDYGFYRPYEKDKGGVAPERWHLSYRPVAEKCEAALTLELLEETIRGATIELKDTLLKELPAIYSRFVVL